MDENEIAYEKYFYEHINIEEKICKLLLKKYVDCVFYPYYLILKVDNKDKEYYETLEKFKYLFNMKTYETNVYLWNSLWPRFRKNQNIDEKDYTKEEIEFIRSVARFYKEECKKYGEYYEFGRNINTPLKSQRLIIKPYDNDTDNKFKKFLIDNFPECDLYYIKKVNKEDILESSQQIGEPFAFAIIKKENNEFIGSIKLELINSDCVYNLSYIIFPNYRKKGYAYEAITRIIEAIKNKELKILEETLKRGVCNVVEANIKRVEAKICIINTASIATIKKCGFKFKGILPHYYEYRDSYMDAEQYDLIIS